MYLWQVPPTRWPIDAELAPIDFIAQHSVFTLDELKAAYRRMGRKAKRAIDTLDYHVSRGRILRVRRGLYALSKPFIDPWLIAAKLTDPVVISHDGALSFHKLTGLGHQLSFMTTERTSGTVFNEVIYRPIRVQKLPSAKYTQEHEREGLKLRVTSVAATLVDCCALLERAPPPLELAEVFKDSVRSVKPRELIDYALTLDNRLVVSRLGFFLMCARFDLAPEEIGKMQRHGVRVPTYFQRKERTKRDSIISKWQLIVPEPLQELWLRAVR